MFSHRQGTQRSKSPIDQCDTWILPELRSTRDIFIPSPTQFGQAKHITFYKFQEGFSFSEHRKLVAESSEFHLTLKRAHRVHFFQLEIRQKSGTF